MYSDVPQGSILGPVHPRMQTGELVDSIQADPSITTGLLSHSLISEGKNIMCRYSMRGSAGI